MKISKDYLHLHFIVFLWGFSAIIGMLLSVGSIELVLFRTGISSVGLWLVLVILKKGIQLPNLKILGLLLLIGVLIAIHWITFFLSARMANVSVCLAGMATCSLWTSFIEPLFNKTRVKGYEIVLGALAFVGLGIIFGIDGTYTDALLVAILSAFVAAVFSVMNGKLTKKYDPIQISFYEMVGATISILVCIPFIEPLLGVDLMLTPTLNDWVLLTILALVCTVYAFTASVEIMKRMSAFTVNLVVNLEPIYGICIAVLVFGESEHMHSWFYIGMLLVLISVFAFPPLNKYYRKKALSTDLLR